MHANAMHANRTYARLPTAALLLLALAACQPAADPAAPPATPAATAAVPATPAALPPPDMAPPAAEPAPASGPDAWLGKWMGPEGTFMAIEKADAGYQLTISDLDGMKFYQGKRAGDGIEFERAGKTESIHATDGKATGMKWLADKANCLTIHAGEGYCRG